MEFKIGDVVQLKSGGPRMSVDRIEPGGIVHCSWFDKTERRADMFNAVTLRPAAERAAVSVVKRSSWADSRRGR